MNTNKLATAISTIILTSTLAACGGGGDGTGTSTTTDVISSGVITQFGSVYVNGVRYHTEGSRIISDDDGSVLLENPSDDQVKTILGLGQVITVRGTRNDDGTGNANTIRFDNELVGSVSSVSNDDGSFVMLGQTISVTPDTIIDDSIIETARNGAEVADDLAFGDPLLTESLDTLLKTDGTIYVISGFPSQNGFEATRIEDIGTDNQSFISAAEIEVKGSVKDLVAGNSFKLNGLTVTYTATELDSEDFPAGSDLEEGMFVEVHADASSATATSIVATRIEREDDLNDDDDFSEGEIEIEGVVQSIDTVNSTITINGIEIPVDDVSLFAEGLRVEIKGVLQGDGSISLSLIKDEAEDTVRIDDLVESVDTINKTFTTRLGLVVTPKDRTRLEDDVNDIDDPSVDTFLGNLSQNDRIEARGFSLNGSTVWTRVELEDDNDQDCRLRGNVDNISGTADTFTFDIEGITITVDNVSANNFRSSAGMVMTKADFFTELSDGDIVQATSDSAGSGCNPGQLDARKVEFEPNDDILFGSSDDSNSSDDSSPGTTNAAQVVGTVTAVSMSTITINDEVIEVVGTTLIDDSIYEDYLNNGTEIDGDLTFTETAASLTDLINQGSGYEVKIDRSGSSPIAISIEDL